MNGIVFVSCGQSNHAERSLGKAIAQLIPTLTPFQGYFAEDQTTLEGFVQNILGSINRSIAFIGVMHHRGRVATPSGERIRGSIWIEQEIAVAAFIEQIVGRKIPIRLYIQNGIKREGMREQLLLNPVDFDLNDEVLSDLATFLPKWKGLSPAKARRSLTAEISYEPRRIEANVHYYSLLVSVSNDGDEALKDYRVDLLFPRRYLNPGNHGLEEPQQSTSSHLCLRATGEALQKTLHPGDRVPIISLDYHVTNEIFWAEDTNKESATVKLSGDGIAPQSISRPMSELHRF